MNKQAEIVKKLSDRELIINLYLTQVIILIIGLGLSRIFFGQWFAPLHFIDWNVTDVAIGVIAGIVIVIIEVICIKILPTDWFDDGGINQRIFENISVGHIAFLSFTVAFSEELLFRGVLQTNFGIVIASFIFAIIHFRYMNKLFLFMFTIFLSFVLGAIYYYTNNLISVIIAHFLIDFILGVFIRTGVYKKIIKNG
ncbi:CPBP family intramembrane metalloprotease [Bacillus shivajii]|uniref:CPBP family intramembrane glutamic endopeptidase n=1 Tax=Bacillus shivajii TaxID=1983719 RepID=UPI001CFBD7C1|nr:CPBP family intramembrane glutamic endopeptidase [Bacillus shivajii]UCZ54737.1 CPBP family intramembrane metalloprotease [Bacillus shivajii]